LLLCSFLGAKLRRGHRKNAKKDLPECNPEMPERAKKIACTKSSAEIDRARLDASAYIETLPLYLTMQTEVRTAHKQSPFGGSFAGRALMAPVNSRENLSFDWLNVDRCALLTRWQEVQHVAGLLSSKCRFWFVVKDSCSPFC
jgi:hypothetical protein